MIDLNMTKNIITDHKIEVISMVCKALKPLQLVVEQLSSRNINILMASTAVDFALKEVEQLASDGNDFAHSLYDRLQ